MFRATATTTTSTTIGLLASVLTYSFEWAPPFTSLQLCRITQLTKLLENAVVSDVSWRMRPRTQANGCNRILEPFRPLRSRSASAAPSRQQVVPECVALPHSYLGELDHHKMVVLSDSFFPTLSRISTR